MQGFDYNYRFLDTRLDTFKKRVSKMKFRIAPRSHVDKNGKSLLYLIVTESGEKLQISLSLYVDKKEWNSKKQRLQPKEVTESSEAINLFIGELESKIHKIQLDYFTRDQVLTMRKFEHEFNSGFSRVDFLQFAESICEEEDGRLAKRSNQKRRSVIAKIRLYKKQTLFSDIDISWVNGYVKFWKKTHIVNEKRVGGNNQTTINSDLKVIKKWLNLAKKRGIRLNIDVDDIKIGKTTGSREYLTAAELKVLWELYFSGFLSERYKTTVGVFLFSCFTSLRISDMKQLKRSDFEDKNNETVSKKFIVTKTQKHHEIKFNKRSLEIVRYNPNLFVIWKSEQKMNEELKDIMKILQINKRISLHCARHTFATNYLKSGGVVGQLQVILGHSSINETMIYVHLYKQEEDDSMELLDNLW